ncbi:MAG: flippase-like domain-containing protein [Deltaproteobacteria bacterium]|nr:flippase-like domain-containing protein [Deltaproteobacteria bacterium]
MNWKSWIGFVISLFFLYLAFRRIDYRLLLESLKGTNYLYLIPVVVIIFVNMALRALRWGYLLYPIKKIGFPNLFAGIIIGFMANNILPARMGEIVRAYVIGRSERISKSSSFATVVVERLFDGFTVLGILLAVLIFINLPSGNIYFKKGLQVAGYISVAIYGVTFIILFIIKKRTNWFLKFASLLTRPFSSRLTENGISNILSFKEGLLSVESVKTLLITFAYSLFIWGVFAYAIYLAGLSFGIKLSVAASLLVLVAICLAMIIPSTPGYIGTYHASVTYALILYSVPLEKALGFSIVFHATNYIPITLAGFLYLWRHHLSLRGIKGEEEGRSEI